MKFSVSLDELQSMLVKTLPAIAQKSTVPVLEHLNFKLNQNKLQIIGTNQDITIMTTLNVESSEEGAVLIPARRFEAFVKTLGNQGELEIEVDIENYDVMINTSKGSFKMKGLDPDEYLDIPELFSNEENSETYVNPDGTIDVSLPGINIKKDNIVRLADKSVFAVSDDDFKPAMTGVLFRFSGNEMIAVSTDGFRLVKISAEIEENPYTEGLDVIIPLKTVELLRKIDSDLTFSIIEGDSEISKIRFDIGDNTVLISKIIKEKFPPFESVIPENNENVAIVDYKELLSTIRRVSLFSSKSSRQIKMEFNKDEIVIKAMDMDSGYSGQESLSCEFSNQSANLGFNCTYIEESLLNFDPKDTKDNLIQLTFSEPGKPVLLLPTSDKKDILTLVMPIRV
jgi:DNA polymerase-3 subunit beta